MFMTFLDAEAEKLGGKSTSISHKHISKSRSHHSRSYITSARTVSCNFLTGLHKKGTLVASFQCIVLVNLPSFSFFCGFHCRYHPWNGCLLYVAHCTE